MATSIRRMRDHAVAIGSGTEVRSALSSGISELHDLADAFHAMAEKVRSREAALREREQWLRVTLGSIGDAVIAFDNEARVTFINPEASRLTGWESADALGQPIDQVFRIVDETTGKPLEDPVRRVLREGGVVTLANRTALFARDGRAGDLGAERARHARVR